MRWKFAFGLASDDTFFVTTYRHEASAAGARFRSKITAFHDEDEFLGHLIRAGLRDEMTTRLARAVLMAVAKPVSPPPWTVVDLTQRQMELLRLVGMGSQPGDTDPCDGKDLYLRAARSGALPQFYDLLMQSPAAIAMLVGPEHRFTFVNASYLELVGANSASRLMGKTVGEAFPQLCGERLLPILDRVYESGQSHQSSEDKWAFYRERTGRVEEGYFNTVCQPVLNAFGEVAGVMLQGTDVTDMVLARDVREHRERLLYRQWAELEAIYRSTPVAMLLVDAEEFRILRANEKQAELLECDIHELLDKPLLEVAGPSADLKRMLHEISQGKPIEEQTADHSNLLHDGSRRSRLKSYAPILSASGKVESIILVGLEVSPITKAHLEVQPAREFASTG